MTDEQKATIDFYKKLIETHADIELKGKTMPYTSANSHMFSQLSKAGVLGIRLPKDAREQFLTEHNTTLFETYGTIMKEYVAVPADMLAQADELAPYLAASYDYVCSMPPKPTKKK